MTTTYDSLIARVVKAINDATTQKLLRNEGARLTINETAEVAVNAIYGKCFKFDGGAKELVEFTAKDERAA